jgi:hypothetical protein
MWIVKLRTRRQELHRLGLIFLVGRIDEKNSPTASAPCTAAMNLKAGGRTNEWRQSGIGELTGGQTYFTAFWLYSYASSARNSLLKR